MLNSDQINQLLEIAETAIHYLYEKYPYSDFSLESIVWDDDEAYWRVKFYLERGSMEHITILLERYQNQFNDRGYSYDD